MLDVDRISTLAWQRFSALSCLESEPTIMRYIALILFSGSTVLTNAQTYRPMLVDGAAWHVWHHSLIGYNQRHNVAGDTLVGLTVYKNLITAEWPDTAWSFTEPWREDTITEQVYLLDAGVELLIYDFSVAPGDTVSVYTRIEIDTPAPVELRLDSITNVLPVGYLSTLPDPRIFHFRDLAFNEAVVWIEGTGSVSGLACHYMGSQDLLCHFDGDGLQIVDHPMFQDPPGSCLGTPYPGSVAEVDNGVGMTVLPDMTGEQLLVVFDGAPVVRGSLSMVDASGRTVQQVDVRPASSTISLDVQGLASGTYAVVFTSQGEPVKHARFVKH